MLLLKSVTDFKQTKPNLCTRPIIIILWSLWLALALATPQLEIVMTVSPTPQHLFSQRCKPKRKIPEFTSNNSNTKAFYDEFISNFPFKIEPQQWHSFSMKLIEYSIRGATAHWGSLPRPLEITQIFGGLWSQITLYRSRIQHPSEWESGGLYSCHAWCG